MQSADWTEVIWRDPRVRYLLADMTLGGNVQLYRDYAGKERDPDSREAYRLTCAANPRPTWRVPPNCVVAIR